MYIIYRRAGWRLMNTKFRLRLTSSGEEAGMEPERNTQRPRRLSNTASQPSGWAMGLGFMILLYSCICLMYISLCMKYYKM